MKEKMKNDSEFDRKETIPVKHVFTQDEMAQLAREQGLLYQQRDAMETQRKHIANDFKARMEGIDSEMRIISNKTASGFEMRQKVCGVVFNTKAKEKDYYDLEDGSHVERRSMQPTDYQLAIPLDDEGINP
jgi:hypothetical protein